MTRNISRPISPEENLLNLPDLSSFRDDEKQHILNVLVRDETLRLKHLSRFMQLRKEVSELEEKCKTTSNSVCARCQTAFGLIFNTGDACPKCLAKVCRQCRLMYNVNDNGWLCQLCCKQMQLMSYSGEWIYSIRNNLENTKSSMVPSPSTPITRHVTRSSNCELEMEEVSPSTSTQVQSTQTMTVPFTSDLPRRRLSRMPVQTSIDESRMKFLHERINGRLSDSIKTQPLPRKIVEQVPTKDVTTQNENPSSTKRLFAPRMLKNELFNKPVNFGENEKVLLDLPDDSLSKKKKLYRKRLKIQRYYRSASRDSDQDSPTTSIDKANRKRLSVSMSSLRDVVHRFSQASSSSDRNRKSDVSVTTEQENFSLKIPKLSNCSNHRPTLNTSQQSFDESKNSPPHTANGTNELSAANQRNENLLPNNNKFSQNETPFSTRSHRLESIHRLRLLVDSDEESDPNFDKGSQISVNTTFSENKARFDLDVSGTIELRLSFDSNSSELEIFVRKCNNLLKTNRQRTINPYVKIYLLPEKSKQHKRKTLVKKDTKDPCFGETFRYRITKQNLSVYIVWISVWSRSSLSRNDFLGEIYLPLAHCTWDRVEEHPLLSRTTKENLPKNGERTLEISEIEFDLVFLEHVENDEFGRIQIDSLRGKAIGSSKTVSDFIVKGLLLPDKTKEKLLKTCRGSSPCWDGVLTWDDIHRETLKNISIEISISVRHRFRKTLFGYVQLSLTPTDSDNNKTVKWFDQTQAEQSIWRAFVQQPTKRHHCQLPLRRTLQGKK